MLRLLRVAVLSVAAAAILTACSSGSGYPDLDREATATDVLPTDLPESSSADFIEGSVRFAGEHDDVEYYLARRDDFANICVVAYRSADDWVGGCGGPNGGFGIGGMGLDVVVAPEGSPELDEGTRVGTNIVGR
jgi:hypothetical protein